MMLSLMVVLATSAISTSLMRVEAADLFRSTHRLELLIQTEMEVLDTLNTYIQTERFGEVECERKTNLVNFYDRMRLANSVSRGHNWVHNPINSLRLLKRFVYEWEGLFKTFGKAGHQSESLRKLKTFINTWTKSRAWPKTSDIHGAMEGIMRLAIIYDLDLVEMADGRIKHTVTDAIPTTEMYQLGELLFSSEQYYASGLVFNATIIVARNRASLLGEMEKGVRMWQMYQRLHESYYEFGSTSLAIRVVNDAMVLFPDRLRELNKTLAHYKLLSKDPDVPFSYFLPHYFPLYGADCHVFKQLCYYPVYLAHIEEELKFDPHNPELLKLHAELFNVTETHRYDTRVPEGLRVPKHIEFYQALCKNEMKNEARLSTLYCEYQTTSNPFYRGKKEYMNIDPDIVVFHDLLTDSECEWIKSTTFPSMRVSVITGDTGREVNNDVRVSETGWMWDETKDEITRRLTRKIELLTGLVIDTEKDEHASEVYQVVNYGVGGMYTIHIDAMMLQKLDPRFASGNRIATFGIYLSDVELGGSTVFPVVKTRIRPQKGSAAFWWNMKQNGDIDPRMLHAGCPVLHGSKWFVNKWVRSNSQVFSHPCSLDPNK